MTLVMGSSPGRPLDAESAGPAGSASAVAVVNTRPRLGGAPAGGGTARAGVRRQAVGVAPAARRRRQFPQREGPSRDPPGRVGEVLLY